MPRLPHLRTALLVLLCSLLAFAALTPAHGNGPCFCLCPWEEMVGGEGHGDRDSAPERDGAGQQDGAEQCEDEVPLRTCEAPALMLAPRESATLALLTRREGSSSELGWSRCTCASDPGGTPARLAAALALRI
ncbi:MAG: hypothetical protein IPN34_23925 [Planctomycetes bacterium]|nr:hypothetical protein [Planctomycetota bacterium]